LPILEKKTAFDSHQTYAGKTRLCEFQRYFQMSASILSYHISAAAKNESKRTQKYSRITTAVQLRNSETEIKKKIRHFLLRDLEWRNTVHVNKKINCTKNISN